VEFKTSLFLKTLRKSWSKHLVRKAAAAELQSADEADEPSRPFL
jgi:hypothetical protein